MKKILLIGNPNVGKTTLFNRLTGQREYVGNRMGVTVDGKSAPYRKDISVTIIDLPGIYCLTEARGEERTALSYLFAGADCIINLADATNLARHLYLTLSLLQTNIPVVLALNHHNSLIRQGGALDIPALQNTLGIPVIPISAPKNQNIDLLMQTAMTAKRGKPPIVSDLSTGYRAVDAILTPVLRKREEAPKRSVLDKILMHRFLALPILFAVLFCLYFLSIQVSGALTKRLIDKAILGLSEKLTAFLAKKGAGDLILSLVTDGVLTGVGSVLAFLPQVTVLFFLLSLLEDCGYLARVAVLTDCIFSRLGMSGKSAISLLLGCGCSVPAILSTRSIENQSDKTRCITLIPFLPCSAKLPLFALLAGAFFPKNPFVAPSMYLIGLFFLLLGAWLLNRKSDEGELFLLELPKLRPPSLSTVFLDVRDKVKDFLVKTGSVVFSASIVLWVLKTFNFGFQTVDIDRSMLAIVGKCFSFFFYPLGLTDWRLSVAFLSGMFGKETVLSSLAILSYGDIPALFSARTALIFMLAMLLFPPCLSALSATAAELGGGKAFFRCILFQLGLAYGGTLTASLLSHLFFPPSVHIIFPVLLAAGGFLLYNGIMRIQRKSEKNGSKHVKRYRNCKRRNAKAHH